MQLLKLFFEIKIVGDRRKKVALDSFKNPRNGLEILNWNVEGRIRNAVIIICFEKLIILLS